MYNYDDEYFYDDLTFRAGKLTSRPVLGICINIEDEEILHRLNNDPQSFIQCIKKIIPDVIFNQAHQKMYRLADNDGAREGYWNQWQDYIGGCDYKKLSKLKNQAELILNNQEGCEPRAINNAKIVLECLKGNFPPRYVRIKSPEEIAKQLFEKKKPKLKLKLAIKEGYKCTHCGHDKEDSLCIIQKDKNIASYELDNLKLVCRSCINKHKTKK